MTTILLVRHARSSANASGVLAGWTPGIDLDERGRSQAKALATRTAELPLVAVVTSPLQRCRSTAAALPGGEDAHQDERFGEVRYGAWTGRPLTELAREPLWEVVQHDPERATFPDGAEFAGESMLQARDRAMTALREWDERVAAEHGPQALWAVVSHGDMIKAILAEVSGAGLRHFQRVVVDPASASLISLSPLPRVWRSNDTTGRWDPAVLPHRPEPSVGGGDDSASPPA